MLSITLGIIFSVLFFTYKPLYRALKDSKFQYKAFIEIMKHEERKKDFKAFAQFQLNKVKEIMQGCFNFINSKINKQPEAEPKWKEQLQEQTQAQETQNLSKEQVEIQTQVQDSKESANKTQESATNTQNAINAQAEAESKDSVATLQDEKTQSVETAQSAENTQNIEAQNVENMNETKNKE